MQEKKQLPPIIITPSATPSSRLAEDYEQARRERIHVRVIEDGWPLGSCWCGARHSSQLVPGRDIHVTRTQATGSEVRS
jgi:hypothetical protein